MRVIEFNGGRKSLSFGLQKMNLHQHSKEFEPNALKPTPGSVDPGSEVTKVIGMRSRTLCAAQGGVQHGGKFIGGPEAARPLEGTDHTAPGIGG